MAKQDGGPAFPTCVSADTDGGLSRGDPGMTLRDWFAGQALIGLLAAEAGESVPRVNYVQGAERWPTSKPTR